MATANGLMKGLPPAQVLSQSPGVQVYAVDLDLTPISNINLPSGWKAKDLPDWGVSRILARTSQTSVEASSILPNSILIAYAVTGIIEDAFPASAVFANVGFELDVLNAGDRTISLRSSRDTDAGRRLAASCSGVYRNEDSRDLAVEYRYYVVHDQAKSPVSWVVETVDTHPTEGGERTGESLQEEFSRIRAIWEDEIENLAALYSEGDET